MTKTFKDLSSSGSAIPKPLFERDFFDMTEEVNLPALPVGLPATLPVDSAIEDATIPDLGAGTTSHRSSVSSIPAVREKAIPSVVQGKPSKKSKAGAPDNIPQPGIPLLPVTITPAGKSAGNRNVRQTFVLEGDHLERIRDYVHARRSQGDYRYSQKQMIEEALDLFLASRTPAPPRPTELREQERQLRVRIQEGRQASADPNRTAKPGMASSQSDNDEKV
jgi:hypothetical protein